MKDVLRKALVLLLCLCICLSLAPASFAEDEGIELADDEEGILEVEPVIAEEEEDDGACETLLYEEAGFFEETKTPPDSESCAEPLFENESVDLPGEDEDETIWSEFCLEDTEVFSAYNPYPYWQTFYYKGVEYTTITCTYYAWQSVYDNLGIALPAWGNGGDWLVNAQASGYATGSTPRANSLVVWTVPGEWGHVAYVTSADGSSFVYNEGGTANRRANSLGIYEGHPYPDGYTDAPTGFIYLTGPDPVPPDVPLADGNYIIAAAADSHFFLDIYGGEYPAAPGTNVVLCYSDDGNVNYYDAWTVKYSNGYYRISQFGQNVSLDVDNESTANGANVQVWANNDFSAQQWTITGNPTTGYRLQARCSGKYLEYENSNLTNGTNVQQWEYDNVSAQKWVFIPYNSTFFLDVNGWLDNAESGWVGEYATFDLYINGTKVAEDANDYCAPVNAGSSYEIKDIKVADGKAFDGFAGYTREGYIHGGRTGTVNANTDVRLQLHTVSSAAIASTYSPDAVSTFNGHSYYFYNVPVTWWDAKTISEYPGGHLVTITSADENAFVNALIKGKIDNSGLWLGATDRDKEGTWKWVTGEAFSYSDWGEGQPDNTASPTEGDENYIHIWGNTGKWNDNEGSVTYPFICEIDTAYTVTYNANGGSGAPAAQVKAHGQAIKLSSTVPSRKGYTFLGWATSASATSAEYQPGDTYSADASLTLYAIWEPMSFTVNNSPYTKGSGQTVSITPITDNSFDGYAYTRTGSYSDAVTISASNYTIQSGRLSFKSAWLDNLSAGTYYFWGIPSLDAPVYLGFMQINAAEISITVSPTSYTKNDPTAVPVAASGTAIPHMARFGIVPASGSSGHLLNNNEYTLSGSTVTLTKDYLNSLADGTYYFIGLTSSNEQIRANSTFTIKSSTAADTPRFTVTYNANGGSGAPGAQTKTQGVNLTLSSAKPTRASTSAGSYTVTLDANGGSVSPTSLSAARSTSYSFKNWNTAANGSGTSYNPGASYSTDANVTLYAQWNSSTTTAAITLPTPTREGYAFKGWAANSTAASGGTGRYTPNGNETLYAIWEKNSPTVQAGISFDSVNANPGAEISVPVRLINNPGVIAVEFELSYNSELLEWTGVEPGEYGALGDYELAVGQPIAWFAADERTDVNTSGVFATLTFRVSENAGDGETVITANIDEENLFNAALENVAFGVIPGTVTIESHVPGDTNGDGKVNNKDYMVLRRYIKYKDIAVVEAALDINGDGKVNNKDYMALRRYIKYKDIVIQ